MKISTKGRYALRLLLELALHDQGETIALKTLASRQEISEKYAEQIIGILAKAGYVKSVRGSSGGYYLAKDPEEYTVGDVLRLTEGSLSPVSCVECCEEPCDKIDDCVTITVWQQLSDAINRVVDGVTLADLVQRRLEKDAAHNEK